MNKHLQTFNGYCTKKKNHAKRFNIWIESSYFHFPFILLLDINIISERHWWLIVRVKKSHAILVEKSYFITAAFTALTTVSNLAVYPQATHTQAFVILNANTELKWLNSATVIQPDSRNYIVPTPNLQWKSNEWKKFKDSTPNQNLISPLCGVLKVWGITKTGD